MSNQAQLVTPIDLRTGEDLVSGKGWTVSKAELWSRTDSELRSAIKRAGSKSGSKDKTIRLAAERVGYENVGFKREWK